PGLPARTAGNPTRTADRAAARRNARRRALSAQPRGVPAGHHHRMAHRFMYVHLRETGPLQPALQPGGSVCHVTGVGRVGTYARYAHELEQVADSTVRQLLQARERVAEAAHVHSSFVTGWRLTAWKPSGLGVQPSTPARRALRERLCAMGMAITPSATVSFTAA